MPIFKKKRRFIMSIEDRAKATGKNIEGKVQEAVGNVTGNPEHEAEGKAKQAEAKLRHGVENVKDDLKDAVDGRH
ncbi:MAG: CsbD family protein [Leptolyngbyaceae cyanobacterium bins.59]|nr:CsbD family protein [Leptolyngbyaceae cyanobacterium bins.59]